MINKNIPPVGDMCKCGKRGKFIQSKNFKEEGGQVLCYWCYHQKDQKRFNEAKPMQLTVTEKAYYDAIERFYLVPLFYGDKPNVDMISIANDLKMGINSHNWKRLNKELNKESEIPDEFAGL